MKGMAERPTKVGAQARTGSENRATASGRCVKVVVHLTTRLINMPNTQRPEDQTHDKDPNLDIYARASLVISRVGFVTNHVWPLPGSATDARHCHKKTSVAAHATTEEGWPRAAARRALSAVSPAT